MRLIDADALEAYLYDEYHGAISDSELYVYQVIGLLGDAPTVEIATYNEAEEQNRLIKLPCKVGDSVWMKTNTGKYERLVIEHFKHNIYGTYGYGYYPEWNYNSGTFSFNSIGKTVFVNKDDIAIKAKGANKVINE